MKNYLVTCLGVLALQLASYGAETPQDNLKEPLVEVDEKFFESHKITLILSGAMKHRQIKNNNYSIDHWVLRNPSIVRIGERVYVRGIAENGPINIKGKEIMFNLSYVQMFLKN